MTTPQSVVLRKLGGLLVVDQLTDELQRLLERTLSYNRLVLDRTRPKRGRQLRPIDCFCYVHDPQQQFPPQFMCGAGYAYKLSRALRAAGYDVRFQDSQPPADPTIFTPCWDRLPKLAWRYKQRYCLEQLLKRNYGRIDCPVGYGKSFLLRLIPRLLPRAKIAITTASVDVLTAIHTALAQDFPDVGIHTHKHRQRGRRINCYSLKSLGHCQEPVDLVLVDEHYEAATDDNMQLLMGAGVRDARKYGFGDNAEDRADQAHFELEGILGPVVVNIPYEEAVARKVVVPLQVRWVDVVADRDPGAALQHPVAIERAAIWRNSHRNQRIAAVARSFPPGEQVLITVFSLEHGLRLRKLLPEYTLCYADGAFQSAGDKEKLARYLQWGLMDSSEELMTWQRREQLRQAFEAGTLQKVIATGVWKRGVDFRRLSVLIRADAHSSTIENTQIPGRTSRLCDETGKQFGLIVDFRDQFSKKYRAEARKRRADYASHGWQQFNETSETQRQRCLQFEY